MPKQRRKLDGHESHRAHEKKPAHSSKHRFAQSQCPKETFPSVTEQSRPRFLPSWRKWTQGRLLKEEEKSNCFLRE